MASISFTYGIAGGLVAAVWNDFFQGLNMLGFAGIYPNSIHQRLVEPGADERRLVLVNRITSVVFAVPSRKAGVPGSSPAPLSRP